MSLTTYIKRLIYPLHLPKNKCSQAKTTASSCSIIIKNIPIIKPHTEIKIFSNQEEDGIILRLLAAINIKQGYFLDIGSNDCINSNCANLAFNFDWKGFLLMQIKSCLKLVNELQVFWKRKNLKFVHSFLYPENINEVVSQHVTTKELTL